MGVILLAIAGYYMREAFLLPKPMNTSSVGAGRFPLLVAAGTMFAVAIMIGLSLLKRRQSGRVVVQRPFWVLLAILVLFAQVYLFDKFGAMVCILVFSALIMVMGGERRIAQLVGVPIGLTTGIYVIFALLLDVNLP